MKSIEWAAGLFEGEGSIIVAKQSDKPIRNGEPYKILQVTLGMTDEDVVRDFHAVAECGMVQFIHSPSTKNKGHKPMWRFVARNNSGFALLSRMEPHLGIRRCARIQEVRTIIADNKRLRGPQTYAKKFTDVEIAGARAAYQAGLPPKQIMEVYGISEGYFYQLMNGNKR